MVRAAALGFLWLSGVCMAAPIEVEVKGLRVDPDAGSPVVQLVEKNGRGRRLPIWIGPFEAQAIAVELEGLAPSRPLTHDLMRQLVDALAARLDRVVVTRLVEGTYHARLELVRASGEAVALDARPSDAVALALRLHSPIFVDEAVFAASAPDGDGPAQLAGFSVQDLTPDLAEVLALPGVRGALVTDVDQTSGARKLRRADVMTQIAGQPVGSAGDVVTQLERQPKGRAIRVALRREGAPLEVRIRLESPPRRDR